MAFCRKACVLLVLFLGLAAATEICSCETELESHLRKLRFSNNFTNKLEEGIFFRKSTLLPIGSELLLLHFDREVASILDLDLDQYTFPDAKCHQKLLKYLSGDIPLPGSQPISIPVTEK